MANTNKSPISIYQPTYILPFSYTTNPSNIYDNNTPDGQSIQPIDFKFQLSFKAPVLSHIFHKQNVLYFAYTQKSFWQAYTNSPFFRENNYEPELFLDNQINLPITSTWSLRHINAGVVHQSNGRGGIYERSWNRGYVETIFYCGNLSVSLKAWSIFHDPSLEIHNPDIGHYLGYGSFLVRYARDRQAISLETYNDLESGFSRGSVIVTYSFPLLTRINGFIQIFNGYGQSLIEYNHRTNAIGLGFLLM